MFKNTYIQELEDELRNSKNECAWLSTELEYIKGRYYMLLQKTFIEEKRLNELLVQIKEKESQEIVDGKVLLTRSQNSREEFVQHVWDESMEVINDSINHQVQRGLEHSWGALRLIGKDYNILKGYSEQQLKEFKDDIKQKMNDTFKNIDATVTVKHQIQPIYLAGMHEIKSFDLAYKLVWGEEEQHNA